MTQFTIQATQDFYIKATQTPTLSAMQSDHFFFPRISLLGGGKKKPDNKKDRKKDRKSSSHSCSASNKNYDSEAEELDQKLSKISLYKNEKNPDNLTS